MTSDFTAALPASADAVMGTTTAGSKGTARGRTARHTKIHLKSGRRLYTAHYLDDLQGRLDDARASGRERIRIDNGRTVAVADIDRLEGPRAGEGPPQHGDLIAGGSGSPLLSGAERRTEALGTPLDGAEGDARRRIPAKETAGARGGDTA